MKIKPVLDVEKISEEARYNPNTRGTHLFMGSGEISESKKDYSNLVLVSLMYERGFLKESIEETASFASEMVSSYENDNVMGL